MQMDPELDKQLKEKYHELENLEKHMDSLSKQLQSLEAKSTELDTIQNAIQDLKLVKEGNEIYVPVSNGIFVKATISDTSKVLINAGANTVVEKDIDGAKEMVKEQQDAMDKFKLSIIEQMNGIDERAYEIERAMDKKVKDFNNKQK